jgi:hypothetical protein
MFSKSNRIIGLSAASLAAFGLIAQPSVAAATPKPSTNSVSKQEKSSIQHVVYIIADNVHLSDIQQMPHLMQFLHRGTLFTNDHTVLDSHTQDGMLSDMTGQYPSKTGVPDQSFYANGSYASFLYWNSIEKDGKPHVTTTPPWQTFNEHGLDVGAVGAPDMELESKSEVQGMNTAVDSNPSDYLGVAVHKKDGSAVFGSPNIPYIYNATSWADPSKTLGGFPGWGSDDPNWPLQATYEMQTHGVPVTFTYLHDVHEVGGKQMPPGQYKTTIQRYDQAFQTFFTKLSEAGITDKNTLFVITTDEGDHYVPGGEHNTNLTQWISQTSGISPSDMNIISDSGAMVYLKDQTELPKVLSSFSAIPGWNYLADPTELKTLHMNTVAAPTRTPSFVVFAKPDVWYNTSGSTSWTSGSNYLYNHGTISPDILTTWLGIVGPGVKHGHVSSQWLDHTDTMPTIYALLGYKLEGNEFDGVPAIDAFDPRTLPQTVRKVQGLYRRVEDLYKQLNAPVGRFGMATLKMSTEASVHANDEKGKALDNLIAALTTVRDDIASRLQTQLLQAWSANAHSLSSNDISDAQRVLNNVSSLAK